jgi:hypothetical protein
MMRYRIARIAGTLVASSVLAVTTAGATTMMHATYKIDAIGRNVTHQMGSATTTDYVKGTITLNTETNQLCSQLQQHGLGMVSSADVNLGAVGKAGSSVAMLNVAQINHKSMHAACVTVTHMLANEILAHPSKYYVVVANAKHPQGAVRSQL